MIKRGMKRTRLDFENKKNTRDRRCSVPLIYYRHFSDSFIPISEKFLSLFILYIFSISFYAILQMQTFAAHLYISDSFLLSLTLNFEM